ncbi:uncharacterized protein MELLADRAFT_52361 [Melampsora larici-populina 98AG31]|uniref:LrgB-like protein n=1 Tax=Melampsora larici-populina (strain 98AG31 / pathotype 3-4-7) TaxID=747676 RepID=F4RJ05_MELLP|nr:uncharacterized protein MELLADRAFT_52361 [Melampsora larici-populina 98AG31]EGG07738.1 hypothetical protein MELLADRAFT_52361 [Melampsora larici-populina 98AG31]
MGLFFTSSFILIPKRDSMSASEIGLICALFLPSFLATWIGTVGICKLLQIFHPHQSHGDLNKNNDKDGILITRGVATSKPETKEDVLVNWMISLFDPIVYLIIFIIGIPVFFSPGGSNRSLPLFLSTVVLSWLLSRRVVPTTWQMILHPILVTSAISVLAIFIFGSIKGMQIQEVLGHYSTGSTYLVLFRKDKGYTGQPPGCGDVMSSILNAGIICLAFPLFRYRQDLYCNFVRIVIVIIPNCVISLFLWPFLANKMGMNGDHSITFAGRFMSTPFGIEFIKATGGDQSLVVVLICFTGIIAVIIRDQAFRLLRVRVKVGSDDYFTIGMTTGVIAAAIGTSALIGNNYHRAAATSTVSFVLYGIILLSLVAVPDISKFVDKLAGF